MRMVKKIILTAIILFLMINAMFFLFVTNSFAELKLLSRFGVGTSEPRSAYVYGAMCYVLGHGGYVGIWDISEPKNVKEINRYDPNKDAKWQAKSDNIKFKGYRSNTGGICQAHNMAVGNFGERRLAFIEAIHQGLQVLDVTDPHNITNMGSRPEIGYQSEGSGWLECIKIKGNYIFTTYWGGVVAYKYSPSISIEKDGGPYEFVSTLNYYGSRAGLKSSYDIDVSYDGLYLYIARDVCMDIVEITNIAAPKLVYRYENVQYPYMTTQNSGICVASTKNLLFFGTSKDLRLFDISNLSSVKPLKDASGKDVIYPSLGSVLDIKIYKNYAFLYYGPNSITRGSVETGLEVVDISNPAAPAFVDSFLLGESSRTDYYRKMTVVSNRGIIILIGDNCYYVLDVGDYIK